MGNVGSLKEAEYPFGNMYIKTDCPSYYPGEKVTGKIYIRCHSVLNAKHITVRIKGNEYIRFYYQKRVKKGKKTRYVTKLDNNQNTIIDFKS